MKILRLLNNRFGRHRSQTIDIQLLKHTINTYRAWSMGDINMEVLNNHEDELPLQRDRIRQTFDQMDTNKDERVNTKEFTNALYNNGIPVTPHVIEKLMRADTDKDGEISFVEFCRIYDEPHVDSFFLTLISNPVTKRIKEKYWKKARFLWPPPIINFIIVLTHVIIHILQISNNSIELSKTLRFEPSNKKEFWRYYSYSLVHADWEHLIVNSLGQIIAGTFMEPVHGPRVAIVYVLGVLSGSLLHAVLDHSYPLVGASAGAFALILSWISDAFLNFAEQTYPLMSICTVLLFLLSQFFMGSLTTSMAAHIAGGISGLLFGIVVLKNIVKHRFEKKGRIIAIILGISCLLVLILMNVYNFHT